MTAEEESKQVMAEELALKNREREALRADLQKIGYHTQEALRRLDEREAARDTLAFWRMLRWPWNKD